MIKNYLSQFILNALLLSCNYQKQECEDGSFEKLKLKPVSVSVMLPPYQILDTTKYGPGRTILDYKARTLDSTVDIMIFIEDYSDYDDAQIRNLEWVTELQKGEVENVPGPQNTLIKESYRQISGIRVGYLKYLVEQKDKNFYEGRIYFYRDKKLVTLWLFEKYRNEEQKNRSIIDCVLESIRMN